MSQGCDECHSPAQVYRAVRNSVQDAAVKLLTNVDAAQLATFSHVIHTVLPCTAVLTFCKNSPHTLCTTRS